MTKLNVVKSVKEWYKEKGLGDSGEARSQDVSDKDINLDMIKLKVRGDTIWSPIPSTTSSGDATRMADVAGACGASNENGSFQKVTITEGTIEGLNTTIKLDLKGTGLSKELGNDIEIDPSKPESCIKREKRGTGRYKEYRGSFACDIEMTGKVIIGEGKKTGVDQIISEIFKDLKSKTSELEHLTFEGKKVVTKMEGTVYFCWEY